MKFEIFYSIFQILIKIVLVKKSQAHIRLIVKPILSDPIWPICNK